MIGTYKFANLEGDNAKRYKVIVDSLERDGLTYSVETKDNGWSYVKAKGKAKPRRAPSRSCGVKSTPLIVAVLQKRLDGLLDTRMRAKRPSWGYCGFNTEGRKADKVFGRAIAGVIARIGIDSKPTREDIAGCGMYPDTLTQTVRDLIDAQKRRDYYGETYRPAEWKPVRERYSEERILEIGYTVELLRLAKARESAKAEKAASKKRTSAPVVELAEAA